MAEQPMAAGVAKQLAEQTFLRARAEMERDETRRVNEELRRLIGDHFMDACTSMTCLMGFAEMLPKITTLEEEPGEYHEQIIFAGKRILEQMVHLIEESKRICPPDLSMIDSFGVAATDEPTLVSVTGDR